MGYTDKKRWRKGIESLTPSFFIRQFYENLQLLIHYGTTMTLYFIKSCPFSLTWLYNTFTWSLTWSFTWSLFGRSVASFFNSYKHIQISYNDICFSSRDMFTNWTTVKPGYVDYSTITYTNGKFIALGGSSYNGKLAYSEDGINWTSVTSPLGSSGTMTGIAYGDYRR